MMRVIAQAWFIAQCRRCGYTVQIEADDAERGDVWEVASEVRAHGHQEEHYGVMDLWLKKTTSTIEED